MVLCVLCYAAPSYKGCWQEPVQVEDRNKRSLYYIMDGNDMTIEKCQQLARSRGYVYAAVQYFSQCYGGSDISNYTKIGVCDTRCTGNKKEVCGGAYANSIYVAGKALHL